MWNWFVELFTHNLWKNAQPIRLPGIRSEYFACYVVRSRFIIAPSSQNRQGRDFVFVVFPKKRWMNVFLKNIIFINFSIIRSYIVLVWRPLTRINLIAFCVTGFLKKSACPFRTPSQESSGVLIQDTKAIYGHFLENIKEYVDHLQHPRAVLQWKVWNHINNYRKG